MSNNIPVLSDDGCCCDDDVPIIPSPDPSESIVVRSVPGISVGNVINKSTENGKTIYELDDFTLVKPVITFDNDQSVVKEVGVNVALVIFSGLITQGSFPIASRSITPDPGGLDLTAAFTFNKVNVKRTSPGVAQQHLVQSTDDHGNISQVYSQVTFKYAFYQGYNGLATLDQAAIKALVNKTLVDSIIDSYGGQRTYVVPGSPATPKYIYWSGPVGTPVPVGLTLSGLAVPLYYGHANIDVTNPNDGSIVTPHWVVRTANRFDPDTYLMPMS